MNRFKEKQKVVCITNTTHHTGFLNVVTELEVGKEYIINSIGKYDFTKGQQEEEAIDIVGGYGGYYPAELFIPANEYKQSLIGDNIYEIY